MDTAIFQLVFIFALGALILLLIVYVTWREVQKADEELEEYRAEEAARFRVEQATVDAHYAADLRERKERLMTQMDGFYLTKEKEDKQAGKFIRGNRDAN